MFSGKIYTAGTNFTGPPVATVATNLNSVSNMRFQMNVRILKIPPVFDDPKVFSKGNVVFDEASILRSQSYFK